MFFFRIYCLKIVNFLSHPLSVFVLCTFIYFFSFPAEIIFDCKQLYVSSSEYFLGIRDFLNSFEPVIKNEFFLRKFFLENMSLFEKFGQVNLPVNLQNVRNDHATFISSLEEVDAAREAYKDAMLNYEKSSSSPIKHPYLYGLCVGGLVIGVAGACIATLSKFIPYIS